MQLTRENTAIVLDSTSDFPEARERFGNMRVVPLYVLFGDESFRDGIDIAPAEFYERLAGVSSLPTTRQPTPQDFADCFEELTSAGFERIWALQVSAKLSGTYQSACLGAELVGGDRVRVVDTETASLPNAMLALAIERRLDAGTTDEEIEQLIERYKRTSGVVFTVATLDFLQKGGRIGKGQALAGTLLNVKPIFSIADGVIEPITKVRGRQKALEEFAKLFTERTAAVPDGEGLRVAIAHASAPEWIDVLTDLAAKARPKAQVELVEILGAVVGTHAGPGAVGFFWFQD
jgi:DegV family protein with EDD domain